jgi:hypothetical protein
LNKLDDAQLNNHGFPLISCIPQPGFQGPHLSRPHLLVSPCPGSPILPGWPLFSLIGPTHNRNNSYFLATYPRRLDPSNPKTSGTSFRRSSSLTYC